MTPVFQTAKFDAQVSLQRPLQNGGKKFHEIEIKAQERGYLTRLGARTDDLEGLRSLDTRTEKCFPLLDWASKEWQEEFFDGRPDTNERGRN